MRDGELAIYTMPEKQITIWLRGVLTGIAMMAANCALLSNLATTLVPARDRACAKIIGFVRMKAISSWQSTAITQAGTGRTSI